MIKRKISLLVALVFALSLSVCAALGVWINSARVQGNAGEPTISGWEDGKDYGFELGGYVEIPAVKITFGSETKDAEVIVTKPDGEIVRSSKVKLTVGGIYTVEFRAVFGNKVKSVKKEFTVETPLFTRSSAKTSWEYGVDDSNYNTGKEGVKIRLAKDDSLVYNEIIDLNESAGQFLEFFLLPEEGICTKDLRKIVVTLTDLHNPNVWLNVILQCANDHGSPENQWWIPTTYVLAGGQNQTPTGIEASAANPVHKGDAWGKPIQYSFYGASVDWVETVVNGNKTYNAVPTDESQVGKQSLRLVYDQDKNSVKVNEEEIIRLGELSWDGIKTFDDPWLGFTTGEVKLSIRGEDFARPFANMMITKIGATDIRKQFAKDTDAPTISVDYDGYDENSLPKAGKGYSYPVFDATANDKVFGGVPVKTTVYYAYESENKYQVNVKDGRFMTEAEGIYTIEYLAYDGYRNEGKKLVKVKCEKNPPSISVEAQGSYETSAKTGEIVFPAEILASGGTGRLKTYATAKEENGSEEFAIDGGFRPEKAGTYIVKLYAEDMIGNKTVESYDLVVAVNDEPVFIEDAILPKVFLKEYNYVLPSIPAYDYSSGVGREQIETTVFVKDGKDNGAERQLEDNTTTFVADEDGFATVIYKAVGKKGSSTLEYKIKVIDAWTDFSQYQIDMTKYFYDFSGKIEPITADSDSVRVKTTQDTSYSFVSPMAANGFETRFAIIDGRFDCVQLVFEDRIDPSVRFTIELYNPGLSMEDGAIISINGKKIKYRPTSGFANCQDFYFTYDDESKLIQDNESLKHELTNADGSAFEGFPSGGLYFTVNISGVTACSEIAWRNVGGQRLSNSDTDKIGPSIRTMGKYDIRYAINTKAEIFPAIALDVLSPELLEAKVTVSDPKGNVVKDEDGLKLENVPFDRSYFIDLTMYGSYTVEYYAMDWMDNVQKYYFAIFVVDDKAPEIMYEGEIKTEVKKGKNFKIVKASAKDNVDEESFVYVYLVDSNGIITKVENGGTYKFEKAGVYELRYMTFDSFGNINIESYEITVV